MSLPNNLPALCLLLTLLAMSVPFPTQAQKGFKCSIPGTKCKALVGYTTTRNATTLADIKALFDIKNLRAILGANDLPFDTPPNYTLQPKTTIKVPVNCVCNAKRTGLSNRQPVYTVQKGDGLDYIATKVFSGLVRYPDIQKANNIKDANLIIVGQKLWIPLPCSCDDVAGQPVLHYAYVVEAGSSLESIASEFGTDKDELMSVNGMSNASQLTAGGVLDVPLRGCASVVSNTSLDYPLRVSNGTYTFTANNCVKCRCDAAQNWTLQCEPSSVKPSNWAVCPSMQCAGANNFIIGNSTYDTSLDSCQTCAYAGYTKETILTSLAELSTCPSTVSANKASTISFSGLAWIVLAMVSRSFLVSF